jgi:energy-coupling factor transport system permease protein
MLVSWRFRKRKSLIQWFDPRAWIIFYACFLISTLAFWDLRYLLPFVGMALLALFTSGVRWHEIRRAFLFLTTFVVFFTFLTFLTGRGGEEVYTTEHLVREFVAPFSILGWHPTLDVTVERAFFAFSQFLRVFSIAIMSVLIPYSLDPALYGVTFKGIGLTDKFAYAMDLTMRFIPTFGRDFQQTMDAQRARGYELEKISGGLIQQVRKLGPIVVPVTIHAIMGSEDIIDAMDLRAFGTGPRTWLIKLTYKRHDLLLILFGLIMLGLSIGLGLTGPGRLWVPEAVIRWATGG